MRVAAALLLAACTGLLSGCSLQLLATQVIVRMDETGPHLVRAGSGDSAAGRRVVPAGETVITVINGDRHAAHTMMLVSADSPDPHRLPARVLRARFASDAPNEVLDISEPLDAEKYDVASGGFSAEDKSVVFHVYLAADRYYFLLDASRVSSGYYLVVHPVGRS